MTVEYVLSLMGHMIWTAMVVSAPILGAMLVVGLLISILQVATQIQEMSLTFIPKMLVFAILLIVLGGWMLNTIMTFAIQVISGIPDNL